MYLMLLLLVFVFYEFFVWLSGESICFVIFFVTLIANNKVEFREEFSPPYLPQG